MKQTFYVWYWKAQSSARFSQVTGNQTETLCALLADRSFINERYKVERNDWLFALKSSLTCDEGPCMVYVAATANGYREF